MPTLKDGEWNSGRVLAILKNEKYTGNALLQKKMVVDHLTKKLIRNQGELPKYYAENTHPAIIPQDLFNRVQALMAQRNRQFGAKRSTRNRYLFSGIIRCEQCGEVFKRKVKRGRASWQCTTFLKEGKASCHTKQIPEPVLYSLAADVLGLKTFDDEIFAQRISEIRVPGFYTIAFVLGDNQRVEKTWQDKSRRESWTDEMRQAAREQRKGC